MSTTWIIKLILSHLLTDFLLQPSQWIDDRNTRHFSSPYLYLHTFITALSALFFAGWQYWTVALVIGITHMLIDGWKSYRPKTVVYFLVDQALHILVIFTCWFFVFYSYQDLFEWGKAVGSNNQFWIITTAFVFLSFPTGIMIGQMTKKWSDQFVHEPGLADAGKWIGILERIIILIFLLGGQYGAIGLLITAKGLLRFSEKDRLEGKTEYVLIGSLISIAFAVATGVLVNFLLLL